MNYAGSNTNIKVRELYHILSLLECDWPQSLRQWDNLEDEIAMLESSWMNQSPPPSIHLDDCLPEPAAAIRLARECDVPNILPAAFYHLSRLSIADNWSSTRPI